MRAEETIASLEAQLKQALEQLSQVSEQLRVAQARIAELEKLKTPQPAFVKATKKHAQEGEKKTRKKREAHLNRARPRAVPTQIIHHRVVNCPQCDLRLGGISLARIREVIDVPLPAPVQVTHHRIYQGWCTGCQRWHEAPLDVHEQVLGQGRIGVRLASLIATLRTVMRLPIRQIQGYLLTVHAMKMSVGEIVELLHRITEHMQPQLDRLKLAMRASPAVQADETGWRENGQNGYIWTASTPTIRYYEYHHSRGGEVVKKLIGQDYGGVLGSDFYAGYHIHQGLHQRCWVHFLRDGHELKEKYPDDEQLFTWTTSVKAIYDEAVAWTQQEPDQSLPASKQHQACVAQQHVFEQQLLAVYRPYVGTTVPHHTLCERVERFLPELFLFVAVPGFPPTTIWPSAAFAPWSSLAKSVAALAVPRAHRPAWDWLVSLAPGPLSTSILFTNVWPC